MGRVTKSPSVMVRPSAQPTTTTGEKISLSPLDKANFPLSVLLLYQSPVNDAANTIKRALSQALVHYYPFCGCVVDGSHIECTGEGAVVFVAASADCSLKQAAAAKLHERPSSSLVEELAVYYPMGSYGAADPLLTVQVTEFACGGFALGATWSHAVADGFGIAQLLGAVGELARGLPAAPSVAPVRWDAAVSSQPPQPDPGRDAVLASLPASWLESDPAAAAEGHSSFLQALEPLPLALLDVTVPSGFIARVKAELPGCTKFEAVLAALWQCRTRAILSSSGGGGGGGGPDDAFLLSSVAFAVNVRRHVGAKDGYYGNCVVDKLVTASSSTVASAGVVQLVEMIKRAKEQVADQLIVNEKGKEEEKEIKEENLSSSKSSNGQLQGFDGRYAMFSVSSWKNIGFEEVDFGSGQPARVMCYVPGVPPIPGCIACLRCEGRDGANVLSCCVKEEHADAFLAEIATLG